MSGFTLTESSCSPLLRLRARNRAAPSSSDILSSYALPFIVQAMHRSPSDSRRPASERIAVPRRPGVVAVRPLTDGASWRAPRCLGLAPSRQPLTIILILPSQRSFGEALGCPDGNKVTRSPCRRLSAIGPLGATRFVSTGCFSWRRRAVAAKFAIRRKLIRMANPVLVYRTSRLIRADQKNC